MLTKGVDRKKAAKARAKTFLEFANIFIPSFYSFLSNVSLAKYSIVANYDVIMFFCKKMTDESVLILSMFLWQRNQVCQEKV